MPGKWFDVPPSGNGSPIRAKAGRIASNSAEYSSVNCRVSGIMAQTPEELNPLPAYF
jgi:hypothetical protein